MLSMWFSSLAAPTPVGPLRTARRMRPSNGSSEGSEEGSWVGSAVGWTGISALGETDSEAASEGAAVESAADGLQAGRANSSKAASRAAVSLL